MTLAMLVGTLMSRTKQRRRNKYIFHTKQHLRKQDYHPIFMKSDYQINVFAVNDLPTHPEKVDIAKIPDLVSAVDMPNGTRTTVSFFCSCSSCK